MMKYMRILLPSLIILIVAIVYAQSQTTLDSIDLTESIQEIKKTNPNDAESKIVAPNTFVAISTTAGDIILELIDSQSPVTVENFLNYVESKEYDSTIFHRVIKNFMIQGGGFSPEMREKKSRFSPILNEGVHSQLRNTRGSIAMARSNNPNSATNQFFINHKDNSKTLDFDFAKDGHGYAVFGNVVEGLNIVDSIANVATGRAGRHSNVPKEAVIINSVKIIDYKK